MRLDLHHKLVPVMQQLLWLVRKTNASRGACDDDGSLGQRRALREEANNLLNRKDEVPRALSAQKPSKQ
jgi:hypothetical protein